MKRKDILYVFISSAIVVCVWVGFNIYHKWVTTTISEDLQIQTIPIIPNFDLKTLEKLKGREKVGFSDIPVVASSTPTPVIIITPTPTSTTDNPKTVTPTVIIKGVDGQ